MFRNYKEKKYMSVIDGDFDLGDGKNEEKMNEAFKDTFDFVKETLGDKVDVVKRQQSSKLIRSASPAAKASPSKWRSTSLPSILIWA